MNYARIFLSDIANGPGARVSLFVSGCTHHCKGCFNAPLWQFDYGELFTGETEEYILGCLATEGNDGLTILGGEPMEIVNQAGIISLVRRAKGMGKSVWIYSGYTLEELKDPWDSRCHGPYTDELLGIIDVLVDGEFHENEKDISLAYRGSRNQRIIYLENGKPIKVISGAEYDKEWRGEEWVNGEWRRNVRKH